MQSTVLDIVKNVENYLPKFSTRQNFWGLQKHPQILYCLQIYCISIR